MSGVYRKQEGNKQLYHTFRNGFTGHEHLDNLGLVHMGGRVYDPDIGRFVSADPFTSGVTTSQMYNRYAYVANNPLRFTDPTGYSWFSDFVGGVANFVEGVVGDIAGAVEVRLEVSGRT